MSKFEIVDATRVASKMKQVNYDIQITLDCIESCRYRELDYSVYEKNLKVLLRKKETLLSLEAKGREYDRLVALEDRI